MKRIPATQRMLIGVLTLAGLAWAVDAYTGTTRPAAASAALSQVPVTVTGPANWEEVDEMVRRLTQISYDSVAEKLIGLNRDLFMPTPLIDAACAPLPAPVEETAPETRDAAPPKPEFGALHELGGVILGESPLAVVDDRVLPLGAVLDGYILVELQRDYAVFQHLETQEQAVLELKKGPRSGPSVP